MIVGAGANIAAQVGDDGVLVVDTGAAGQSDKVLAAIKGIANGKEIRWIINTTPTADHTGNNEQVSKAGRTVNGNQAAVVAHENANARMIERGVPDAARPYNTYFEASRDFPYNGEPVILYHNESSVNDADTVVFFRRSDVIAAGDVFRTDSFPVIDVAAGGSIQGDDRRAQPAARPDRAEQDAAGGGHLRHSRATAASATSTRWCGTATCS